MSECGEIQARARQVFVEGEEVVAPVAVISGLATIGQTARPVDRVAAGESLVWIVGDRRDPYGAEAEVADVVGVVQHAFEIAAEVADVVRVAVRTCDRNVERAIGTALLALIVARVAVDEAVGDDEVDRLAGEGFSGAIERS